MGVSVEIVGADAIMGKLMASIGTALNASRTIAQLGGYIIERNAKSTTPVDTGALRGSIGTHYLGPFGYGWQSKTNPQTFYAAYVEYGSQGRSPNPYMGRGFRSSIGPVMGMARHTWGGVL